MIARVTLWSLALLAVAAPAVLAQGRGTGAGRYSAEQAEAGARTYAIHCAMCHGEQLEGKFEIPPLTGRFVANWAGRPVADLFAYVSDAMPQHAPGILSPAQNAELVALLLRENGAPVGGTPLPADRRRLERIAFDPIEPRS